MTLAMIAHRSFVSQPTSLSVNMARSERALQYAMSFE